MTAVVVDGCSVRVASLVLSTVILHLYLSNLRPLMRDPRAPPDFAPGDT